MVFVVTADYKVPNVSLAVTRCVLGMLSHSVTVMMTQRSDTAALVSDKPVGRDQDYPLSQPS